MCLYHFCLSYRGRESFSGGGASEIGGARLVGGGGGEMKAKKENGPKKALLKHTFRFGFKSQRLYIITNHF